MSQLEFMLSHAPATTAIIAAIVVTSVVGFRSPAFSERLLLRPWKLFRGNQFERLITSGFLHADVMHLLFNLIALYSVSMYVEAAAGTRSFLVIYFGSLVLPGLIVSVRRRDDPEYRALGASGAISGLFFAGMLYFPDARVMLMFLPIPMPWPVFAVLFIAGSMYGAKRKWDNVAHDVHLYGALTGLLLTVAVDPASLTGFLRTVGWTG